MVKVVTVVKMVKMVTIDMVVKVIKMVTIDMDAMDQTHRLHPTLGQGR